ncbi:MAG TPA: sigma-70 family RNA polymerase sigma factor [Gemmatimonadales bacterium]|nr:sigma-70 family RNA polymerase sigma factor [Gemmatimonadales bacterium]
MKETPLATDAQDRQDEDRALVRRYLEDEPDAAPALVDRYQQRLFNVALRMLGNVQDAEDVTQTVFLNAFRNLRAYDPRFKFFSWIYRMAVNESLNQLKRRKQTVTLGDDSDLMASGGGAGGAESVAEAEDHVGRALQSLNPDDRAVVVLKHFMSFSYQEIAEVLGIPVQTVKSRLFTARERLRVALDGGVQ